MPSTQEIIQQLDIPPIVQLFEITFSGTTYRYTNTFRGDGITPMAIYWNGNQYIPLPISIIGVGFTQDNGSEAPKLTLSNVNNAYTAIFPSIPKLKGAKLTYISVFEPHVFPNATGNNALYMEKHRFTVDKLISSSPSQIVYSLLSLTSFKGEKLPGRQMLREGEINLRFEGLGLYKDR